MKDPVPRLWSVAKALDAQVVRKSLAEFCAARPFKSTGCKCIEKCISHLVLSTDWDDHLFDPHLSPIAEILSGEHFRSRHSRHWTEERKLYQQPRYTGKSVVSCRLRVISTTNANGIEIFRSAVVNHANLSSVSRTKCLNGWRNPCRDNREVLPCESIGNRLPFGDPLKLLTTKPHGGLPCSRKRAELR